MPYLSWKKIMKYSGLFAVVSLVMIVLGYMGGEFLTFDYFQQVNGMVLALLFAFIGSRFLFKAFSRNEFIERLDKNIDLKRMCHLAFSTSVDWFILGASLRIVGLGIVKMAILTTLYTFLCVLIGLKIGQLFGAQYQKIVYCIAGTLLYISSFALIF